MRTKMLSLLLAANVAAGALLTVAARPAAADEAGIRDCCKTTVDGTGFCCDNCCWVTSDCNYSSECSDKQIA